MNETLERRISQLDDEDLLLLLTTHAEEYRPEALEQARAEAARRNLEVKAPRMPEDRTAKGVGSALRSFADGVASELGSGRYTAAGRPVSCAQCGADEFVARPAVVNTRGLTFFGLDWLDRGAVVLVCERCGLLTWFQRAPDRVRY